MSVTEYPGALTAPRVYASQLESEGALSAGRRQWHPKKQECLNQGIWHVLSCYCTFLY